MQNVARSTFCDRFLSKYKQSNGTAMIDCAHFKRKRSQKVDRTTFCTERKSPLSSDWKDVYSGVPQSSILGPTLFIIYIIDISQNLSEHTELPFHADNAKCYRQIKSCSGPKLPTNVTAINVSCLLLLGNAILIVLFIILETITCL